LCTTNTFNKLNNKKKELENLYTEMINGDVLLAFKGDITPEILSNTLNIVESKLECINVKAAVKKRVYHLLVESLQNLYHHSDTPTDIEGINENEKFGCFILSLLDDKFRISTANLIQKKQKEYLEERISKINSLSKDQLRDLYKTTLNNDTFSDKGGGGLGLMDIARKTGNKLDYKFSAINDNCYFYRLNININKEIN